MATEARIPLADLLTCLSDALDLMSPELANHHAQTAYIASSLAREMGLSDEERETVVLAASLHDVGVFSASERRKLLQFDDAEADRHGAVGYLLLRMLDPFEAAARVVRYHHARWDGCSDGEAPLGSHLLHLADRIAVLVRKDRHVLGQVRGIEERVTAESGRMFMPELLEVFRAAARREFFWFDVVSRRLGSILRRREPLGVVRLDTDALLQLANLFRRIIDFKSPYTATHCSGVAATAEALARLGGLSREACERMRVASYLHDVGKLAVPGEILEKRARLTRDEFEVMQSHVYYTYRILEPLEDLGDIREWAGFHQERLDGSGYPFRLRDGDLSDGARILAVADVFTAITEDRPYRKGMASREALRALQGMALRHLDGDVVGLLESNFDELDAVRVAAQDAADGEYRQFLDEADSLVD